MMRSRMLVAQPLGMLVMMISVSGTGPCYEGMSIMVILDQHESSSESCMP